MKKIVSILILCLTACARPPEVETQVIPVFSEPQGAEVVVDGRSVGVTPISLALEKTRDHMITISKSGFRPEAVPVQRTMNHGRLAMNTFMGISQEKSFLTDPLREIRINEETGRAYQLTPNVISISLHRMVACDRTTDKKPLLIEEISHLGSSMSKQVEQLDSGA